MSVARVKSRLQYDTTSFFKQCQNVLKLLNNHTASWPFKKPVNLEEVPDYSEFIKHPMGRIHSYCRSRDNGEEARDSHGLQEQRGLY